MTTLPRILYCHCAYAQVVPPEVKLAVLKGLCESGQPFDAVADLCELSARRDPLLGELAGSGALRIAACYPRAVKWLFAAAKAPLAESQTEVLNMRVQNAEDVLTAIANPELKPNIPAGKAEPNPPTDVPSDATASTPASRPL